MRAKHRRLMRCADLATPCPRSEAVRTASTTASDDAGEHKPIRRADTTSHGAKRRKRFSLTQLQGLCAIRCKGMERILLYALRVVALVLHNSQLARSCTSMKMRITIAAQKDLIYFMTTLAQREGLRLAW